MPVAIVGCLWFVMAALVTAIRVFVDVEKTSMAGTRPSARPAMTAQKEHLGRFRHYNATLTRHMQNSA